MYSEGAASAAAPPSKHAKDTAPPADMKGCVGSPADVYAAAEAIAALLRGGESADSCSPSKCGAAAIALLLHWARGQLLAAAGAATA